MSSKKAENKSVSKTKAAKIESIRAIFGNAVIRFGDETTALKILSSFKPELQKQGCLHIKSFRGPGAGHIGFDEAAEYDKCDQDSGGSVLLFDFIYAVGYDMQHEVSEAELERFIDAECKRLARKHGGNPDVSGIRDVNFVADGPRSKKTKRAA